MINRKFKNINKWMMNDNDPIFIGLSKIILVSVVATATLLSPLAAWTYQAGKTVNATVEVVQSDVQPIKLAMIEPAR